MEIMGEKRKEQMWGKMRVVKGRRGNEWRSG